MNPEPSVEERSWSAARWLILIAFVFTIQIACIFGLSDPPPVPRPTPRPVPVFSLAGKSWAPFLALRDPTWFALPHRQGFSGVAWMTQPEPEFYPFTYTSPPEFLRLPNEQPGLTFCEFTRTNDFSPSPPPPNLQVALTRPEVPPLPLARERSQLRVEGPLAHRALLSHFALEPKKSASLLTNSIVRVLVSPDGRTQSAALLNKGSGSVDADREALADAALARFAPLPPGRSPGHSLPGLTEGYLIFEWQTVTESSPTAAAPGL